jgi:hypothetical protein
MSNKLMAAFWATDATQLSTVIAEKLTDAQLVKNFHGFLVTHHKNSVLIP